MSGLVLIEWAAKILQKVCQIDISTSSVWRRVVHWGKKLQAIESRQQVKAYELEEPRPHDPNRSLGMMEMAMDAPCSTFKRRAGKN